VTDAATEEFLQAITTPRRREHPRLSETLRDVEVRHVATPHGTVAAWRIGDGPATLLVHGWEDDNSLWGPMIAALVGRGHAVVVFDLPAHGHSDGESGLGFEAADATRAVAELLAPIEAIGRTRWAPQPRHSPSAKDLPCAFVS
jgi:pimeloyl-ACP methyl ester carboxylesterase